MNKQISALKRDLRTLLLSVALYGTLSATFCTADTITVAYTYDAAGRLTFADYSGDNTIAYAYDPNGNLTQRVVQASSAEYVTNAPVPVPVNWLGSYGITGDLAAANTNDLDGDGVPTWEEYVMDTNPTNAQSRLALLPDGASTSEGNLIVWSGSPNRSYGIYWGTDLRLGITNPLVENIRPAGYGSVGYTDTVHLAEHALFYSIQVDLP